MPVLMALQRSILPNQAGPDGRGLKFTRVFVDRQGAAVDQDRLDLVCDHLPPDTMFALHREPPSLHANATRYLDTNTHDKQRSNK